ncbi:hypothetical protein ACWJJH_12975 [Endozoicomonadaceae bacterium StTr2]
MSQIDLLARYTSLRIEHDMAFQQGSEKTPEQWILSCAEQARRFGIGNCFEQACLGYQYVRNAEDIALPVAVISLYQYEQQGVLTPYDHTFLLLGTYLQPPACLQVYLDEPPAILGKESVICDPWAGCSYGIFSKEFPGRIRDVLREIKSIYKKSWDIPDTIYFHQKCYFSVNNHVR